jgi:hypothetical protein
MFLTSMCLKMARSMDDVTLWTKALSIDIITQIYRDQTTQQYFCCPKSCPTGQISKNLCSGTYTQDCGMAYSCPVCRFDHRLSLACSGGGSSVPVGCLPCKSSCPSGTYSWHDARACLCMRIFLMVLDSVIILCMTLGLAGQYRAGTCGPTATSDYTCRDCTPACGDGQYITRSCSDGMSFSDTACGTCKACPSGSYMSAKCTGTEPSDPIQCKACKVTCGPGSRTEGVCDGTAMTDTIGCSKVCVLTRSTTCTNSTCLHSLNG